MQMFLDCTRNTVRTIIFSYILITSYSYQECLHISLTVMLLWMSSVLPSLFKSRRPRQTSNWYKHISVNQAAT